MLLTVCVRPVLVGSWGNPRFCAVVLVVFFLVAFGSRLCTDVSLALLAQFVACGSAHVSAWILLPFGPGECGHAH